MAVLGECVKRGGMRVLRAVFALLDFFGRELGNFEVVFDWCGGGRI